ncbi:MAG TPA: HAMP domain-containing sensor histidine kinase [Nitrospira sp.]|nr:HAMP domain-containing sensor histidine kinase [Nitrospira sp.]
MHEGKAADPPPEAFITDSEPFGYQETISIEKQETPKPLPSERDGLRRMNQQARNAEDESHQTGVPYDWYYRTSKWFVDTVALIAVLVLTGWTFHITRLTSLSPDFASMKVTTAIGLLLLAGALLFLNPHIIRPDPSGTRVRNGIVFVLAAMAGLLGLGTLFGYATHVEGERVSPAWTGPATALCFVLLGGAVFASMKQNVRHYVSQSLATVVIFICSLAVLGYLFHKQSLYAIPSYKSMALHTAVSFVLLSLALLCLRPDQGLMKTATAGTAGGSMLQRMVPLMVGMVLIIGWVHLMGETVGLYNSRFSLLMAVGMSVVGFSIILWTVAGSLNQIDAAKGLSERRLQHAIKQLRASDEQKTRLLYTVSHEYRTPLNGIIGISRFLLNRADGPLTPEQDKQITMMQTGAQQLLVLIDTMLDLDKIKTGKLQPASRRCTVPSLLQSLRVAAELFPSRPGVSLVIKEPDSLPELMTDDTLLSRILYNFVHNAVKYTEHGTIIVSAESVSNGRAVRFVVRDSGVGIAPEDQARIFDEFVQIRHPLQQGIRGQGLGLALCKRLADVLDAIIMVKSQPGKGSTFSVTVPCEQKTSAAMVEDERQEQAQADMAESGTFKSVECRSGSPMSLVRVI